MCIIIFTFIFVNFVKFGAVLIIVVAVITGGVQQV